MNYAKKKKQQASSTRIENASTGLQLALKKEDAVRKQLIVLVIVCIVLYIFFSERRLIKQTLALGALCIITEMLNSSVERLCDVVQPNKDERIRKIKDMLAGATLYAVIIAGIITLVDILILTQSKFF